MCLPNLLATAASHGLNHRPRGNEINKEMTAIIKLTLDLPDGDEEKQRLEEGLQDLRELNKQLLDAFILP